MRSLFYRQEDGCRGRVYHLGPHRNLAYTYYLWGDCTHVTGFAVGVRGDVTGVVGDLSNYVGDVSLVVGHVSARDYTKLPPARDTYEG